MIGYICGTVQAVSGKYAIIDVHGVGYRVALPAKNLNSIAKIGEEVKLYTHFTMSPRDGSVELYGFGTPEELNFYELLTTISGIGPKSAQAIISAADLQTLQLGIIKGDADYLKRVAGIGEKTAMRLVLELKNKILSSDLSAKTGGDLSIEGDAIEALMALGYSQFQARDAMQRVGEEYKTSEEKIKAALKMLAK